MERRPKLKAPAHLKAATRRWWQSVVDDWQLEEHHVRLLTLAAIAWDRAEEARRLISEHGLTTPTRDGGAKLSPLARVEQDATLRFARLIRELDLDVDPPAAAKRPPMLASIQGGRHAS
jgi:P27 family predicted phage terminase small subunit